LGEVAFSAQYQQQPLSSEGQVLKPCWIQYYQTYPERGQIVQSWDTAIKTGIENDYSVCTIWIIAEGNYYLIDVFRAKLEFPELKKKALYLAEAWKPDVILIEDKASGQPLIQELIRYNLPIAKIKPIYDKVVRFAAVTTYFAAGKVFFPEKKLWLNDFVEELLAFPMGDHDDQVDSCSQFLGWIKNIDCISRNLRVL
jgi:predicted phage terminase large subunit-like protein